MIPIGDSVRSRTTPYVNITLIIINIIVFLYEVYLSQDVISANFTELDRFIFEWANIPACTFESLGVDAVSASIEREACGQQPEPLLTPLTAMFMHGGWLHIAGNMLFLWIFGDNVEDAMGHVRYAIFYILSGIIAAFSHGLYDINSTQPAVGASGAIAGVMGGYLVLFPRATVAVIFGFIFIPIPIPAIFMIGFWFVLQLFYGAASIGIDTAAGGVAYWAHIGGFVAGAALVKLFAVGRDRYIARIQGRTYGGYG